MTTHPDLEPAARRMASLVEAVPDDALGHPTPCEGYSVGDPLDHIAGAALAFDAAAKMPLEGGPSGDAANLGADWRARTPRHVLGWVRGGATRTPGPARRPPVVWTCRPRSPVWSPSTNW